VIVIEIEISVISTAKSGLPVTLFSANHGNIWSENNENYTAHTARFQFNTAHFTGCGKKYQYFCGFL